jgi:carboxylate-amine ligase
MSEALAVGALALACIAAFAAERDAGRELPAHPRALVEENIWRAERYGLEGRLIDFDRGQEHPTRAAIAALLEWSAPVHEPLGLTPFLAAVPAMLENGNGAMRQLARLAELGDVRAVHAEVVDRTRRSAEEALRMATAGAA